jgi:type 1 glutamine amidotransferase
MKRLHLTWILLLAWTLPLAAADKADTPSDVKPLQVCLISGPHYGANESLGEFQKYVEENYRVKCSRVITDEYPLGKDLPGIEVLDTSDVMVVFTRRITVPPDQLERVKKWCAAGKPVIGIRTASHAFQNWSHFSPDVLGAKMGMHFNNVPMELKVADQAEDHPILAGVKPFPTNLGLYQYTNHAPEVQVLLTGKVKDKETEPVAWAREVNGGRVFYTSLGGTKDFEDPNFRQLLVNALSWTTRRDTATLKK